MSKSSEKIVRIHLLLILFQTLLQTVKNKSLVIPQSKGKYELMKIVELMKPRISFVDVAIIVILIRTFNEMVIELASGGYVNIPLKVNRHSGKALRNCVAKTNQNPQPFPVVSVWISFPPQRATSLSNKEQGCSTSLNALALPFRTHLLMGAERHCLMTRCPAVNFNYQGR